MRFKLDENFGTRTQLIFQASGYEVQTVPSQGLQGCSDQRLYELCCIEERCLVTLDLDFADVTRFSPAQANGIVIIRASRNPSVALLEQLVRQFLQAVKQMPVEKRLWIVEVGRIRVHELEIGEEP